MDADKAKRIAAQVGFATGGVGAFILPIAFKGELTGAFDTYKVAFVGGMVGWGLGYALAKLVLEARLPQKRESCRYRCRD